MQNLADWIKPEWIIAAVGAVVALVIFLILRNLGKRDGEPTPSPDGPEEVKPEASAHGERRATPRKKTVPVVVDLLDPEGKRPRQTALVVDRSTGGLALHSQEEIPIDTTWNAVPRSQRGTVKVSVLVEVRNCVRDDAGYLVNCRFLRTVSYNELMNFE